MEMNLLHSRLALVVGLVCLFVRSNNSTTICHLEFNLSGLTHTCHHRQMRRGCAPRKCARVVCVCVRSICGIIYDTTIPVPFIKWHKLNLCSLSIQTPSSSTVYVRCALLRPADA